MRTTSAIAAAVAVGLGGLVGAFALLAGNRTTNDDAAASSPRAVWTEVQWPFPMDQWGKGKAFRCKAADCGAEVNLYLRAKLGSCNCTTGVADDAELDRMSDFDLVGGEVSPLGAGRPITIAWMKGRSRAYTLTARKPPGKTALSVAFNDRCDMVVATAVLPHDRPAMIEPGVLAFLNGSTVLRWAEVALGL
jgi:Flp pilus assembly protein CpaB